MHKQLLAGQDVFLIHDFLSREECDQFIARAEQEGYEEAPITTAGGPVMRKSIRDNSRVMFDVFVHHNLHEGAPVLAGRKYVLRTDVMYQRLFPGE